MATRDGQSGGQFLIQLVVEAPRGFEQDVFGSLLYDGDEGSLRSELDQVILSEVRAELQDANVVVRVGRGSIVIDILVGVASNVAWDVMLYLARRLRDAVAGWLGGRFGHYPAVRQQVYVLVVGRPQPRMAFSLTPTTAAIVGGLLAQLTLVFAVVWLIVNS